MTARYIVGDSLTVLRSLPDASVDLVLTSPPFLALRAYLPPDHPDKSKEVGTEPTPGEFIDSLVLIVEECRRVLALHGSLVFELGDTYSGSGGAGGDYNPGGLRDGQERFDGSASRAYGVGAAPRPARVRRMQPNQAMRLHDDGSVKTTPDVRVKEAKNVAQEVPFAGGDGWPLDKSLCLVPEILRFTLVYGFNPLTGRRTARWRARNVVRWCRPNPPVGALGDKVRPATSDLIVACVSRTRYFDLDAVRQPHKDASAAARPHSRSSSRASYPGGGGDADAADADRGYDGHRGNVAGAPPLDHWWHDDVFEQDAWLVCTEPFKGSHYATWPSELLTRPILAMCPQRVCVACGEPSRRIVDAAVFADGKPSEGKLNGRSAVEPWRDESATHQRGRATFSRVATTIGWTDCSCEGGGVEKWRPGVVLDPFAGSGTTLAVATGHGRDAIGIDLDERNADLARQRVGMFLEVEHHPREVVA